MNIWELQNSTNILDRQQFVKRIKFEFMPKVEERITKTQVSKFEQKPESISEESWKIYQDSVKEVSDYELALEKRILKGLKIMLSNYDIYNQKMIKRCSICKEENCICHEAGLETGLVEADKFETEIKTLFE